MKVTYHGSCHCGAVRFTSALDLDTGTSKCNCSVCTKARFWKAIAKADALQVTEGESALSDYQFGSQMIHHLFCRHCGIKVFGRGSLEALGGTFYAVNLACLDDLPPAVLARVPVTYEDGRHNNWQSPPADYDHL